MAEPLRRWTGSSAKREASLVVPPVRPACSRRWPAMPPRRPSRGSSASMTGPTTEHFAAGLGCRASGFADRFAARFVGAAGALVAVGCDAVGLWAYGALPDSRLGEVVPPQPATASAAAPSIPSAVVVCLRVIVDMGVSLCGGSSWVLEDGYGPRRQTVLDRDSSRRARAERRHLRGPTAASPARPSSPPATTTTTPPSTPGRAAAPQEPPSVRRASTISRCACLTETCSPPQSRASAATTTHRVAHDHGGSVAVVLRDPDGVELSYDHPRAEWLDADGEIIVKAEPFEPDELLPWARRRSRLAASGCAVNMNPSPVLLIEDGARAGRL